MTRAEKLYQKAKNSKRNFKYSEICLLAQLVGFEKRNQEGSHLTFNHPLCSKIMNFQPDKKDKSKAKVYQVGQLLDAIDDFNLLGE